MGMAREMIPFRSRVLRLACRPRITAEVVVTQRGTRAPDRSAGGQ